jgi:hypothetical protein
MDEAWRTTKVMSSPNNNKGLSMGKGWMSVLVQRRKLVNNVFSYDDYRGADRAQFESLQKSLSRFISSRGAPSTVER